MVKMDYIKNDTQFAIGELALKLGFWEIDAKAWSDVPEDLKKEVQELTGVELYDGRCAQAIELAKKMSEDNKVNWAVCAELEEYEREFLLQKQRDMDSIQSIEQGWL